MPPLPDSIPKSSEHTAHECASNPTVLMLTLFPEQGNGSATLISDLVPELEKLGHRTTAIFVDTSNTESKMIINKNKGAGVVCFQQLYRQRDGSCR